MRAGINCALANREIIAHLTREAFASVLPGARLTLLYDVSHNTCKVEQHLIDGKPTQLFVHRKGATRAFGPGHPDLPQAFHEVGQPVLIGGVRRRIFSPAQAVANPCHSARHATEPAGQ
jgi:tRNA-splicing ligase RtcB (3'-phosphate/5'-hydroxy nucleic acid ligase)